MFGKVFICRFPFTTGAIFKPRPVLALFDLGQDVIIYRITSVAYGGPLDGSLLGWQDAGLAKPSVARLGRLLTGEKTTLTRQLGTLIFPDQAIVRASWNQHMRL